MIELVQLVEHPSSPPSTLVSDIPAPQIGRAEAVTLPLGSHSAGALAEKLSEDPARFEDALITVMANAVPIDWKFDVIVRVASSAGAAAIAVDPIENQLPLSVRRLAERFGIALVVCAEPARLHSQCLALLSEDWRTRNTEIIDVLSLAATGLDLESVVAELEGRFEQPVYLFDSTGHEVTGRLFDSVNDQLDELGRFCDEWSVRTEKLAGSRMIMTAPIRTDLPTTFWLGITAPEMSRAEQRTLSDLLAAASMVCAHALVRSRLTDETGASERRALIDELLLTDPDNPRPEVRRRIADLGWEFTEMHSVARISCSPAVDVIGATRAVRRAFTSRDCRVSIAEVDDGWFVWHSVPSEAARQRWKQTVRSVNRELRDDFATSSGISSVRSGLAGFICSLPQADDAARIAWNRPQSGYVAVADDLGFDQLLLSWTSAETFAHTTGELLRQLDGAGRDLTTTLLAYLDAESSIAETAAVLGVHRNTVSERIRRIESVLGVSLRDPETRLALHLAARVERRFRS